MDIKKVTGVYFSPAGSTKTVVETTVDELARLFKAECRYISLNTPSDRAQEYQFAPDELVVFGCPVYAGRLPNKISPDFARCLHGEGTPENTCRHRKAPPAAGLKLFLVSSSHISASALSYALPP